MTLYTKKQLSKEFQVSEKTVQKWIARGELKAFRKGAVLRITESAVQEFINKQGEEK